MGSRVERTGRRRSPGTSGHFPAPRAGAAGTPLPPPGKAGRSGGPAPPAPRTRAPRNEPKALEGGRCACCSPKRSGMARWAQERVCGSCASNLLSVDFQARMFDAINVTFFYLNSVCVCVNMQQVVYYIPRLFYYGLFL